MQHAHGGFVSRRFATSYQIRPIQAIAIGKTRAFFYPAASRVLLGGFIIRELMKAVF
jgi:hypothetical protein